MEPRGRHPSRFLSPVRDVPEGRHGFCRQRGCTAPRSRRSSDVRCGRAPTAISDDDGVGTTFRSMIPESSRREWSFRDRACAYRLDAQRGQRLSRIRGAVVSRRTAARCGKNRDRVDITSTYSNRRAGGRSRTVLRTDGGQVSAGYSPHAPGRGNGCREIRLSAVSLAECGHGYGFAAHWSFLYVLSPRWSSK